MDSRKNLNAIEISQNFELLFSHTHCTFLFEMKKNTKHQNNNTPQY